MPPSSRIAARPWASRLARSRLRPWMYSPRATRTAVPLTSRYDTPRPLTNRYLFTGGFRSRPFEAAWKTSDCGIHARVPEMGLEDYRREHILVGFRRA